MDRLNSIGFHLSTPSESLKIKNNRNGMSRSIQIDQNTIRADHLNKATKTKSKPGVRVYDPGLANTASARSSITFIDGDNGILKYRGYKIEELAEKSSFLEVAFLIIYGDLPSKTQKKFFENKVMQHTFIHSDLVRMMQSFRYDAHPMGIFAATVAAMSTLHPEANPSLAGQTVYNDLSLRNKQIHRLLGTVPTIAAFSYRHRQGRPFVYPSHQPLSYTENFLYMLDRVSNHDYTPNKVLSKALDTLFILHADHELNCSTAALRHLSSSGVDVYSAISGAAMALYGPKHGGANQAVLKMLKRIGSVNNIDAFLAKVKAKEERLMGFGHRVYKNYDPRAKMIKGIAREVFEVVGEEPLIRLAVELERRALSDSYFTERKLYPNIDFYSGLIYKAMGFPEDFFPVLFAIPRVVGWLAHWNEFLDDPEARITRPRQIYVGHHERTFKSVEERTDETVKSVHESYSSTSSKRRNCSDQQP